MSPLRVGGAWLRRRRALARLRALGIPVHSSTDPARVLVLPAAAVAGLAAALVARRTPLVALLIGAGAAVGAVLVLRVVLARQDHAARADRLVADLPVALDLIGACLIAGVTVADAVAEVGSVLDSELARALAGVGRALRRGVPDAQAWAVLEASGVPEPVAALARAAVRSATTGSALEPWIAALGRQARAELEGAAARAAVRAGVLAVLPLGLCALPAYLLLAVVPAVVGLLRHLR